MTLVLFSANDAGGANAIAPVIEKLRTRGNAVHGLIGGPAKAVFGARGIPYVAADDLSGEQLNRALSDVDFDIFLAGTSGGDTIEKRIFLELERRRPSVWVLDFWSNLWQRFSGLQKDLKYLPDKICVMDRRAEADLIAEGIGVERVVVTGNPHFEEFTSGIDRSCEDWSSLLFLSQPLSEAALQSNFTNYGFDEFSVLQSIIRTLNRFDSTLTLNIRAHPSERSEKFHQYMSERVLIREGVPLSLELAQAGLVIGMFSPALIQAALAGKPTLSYEPGILVADPLPTNALGITRRVTTEEELELVLRAYCAGGWPILPRDLRVPWLPGAADRVVAVLDDTMSSDRTSAKVGTR